MKNLTIALLVAVSLGTAARAEDWTHPDSEMTWRFYTNQPNISVMLWSANRKGHNWGPFSIPANKVGADTGAWRQISCKVDEVICYGATDGAVHWGLDKNGSGQCSNCCFRCDGQVMRDSVMLMR